MADSSQKPLPGGSDMSERHWEMMLQNQKAAFDLERDRVRLQEKQLELAARQSEISLQQQPAREERAQAFALKRERFGGLMFLAILAIAVVAFLGLVWAGQAEMAQNVLLLILTNSVVGGSAYAAGKAKGAQQAGQVAANQEAR